MARRKLVFVMSRFLTFCATSGPIKNAGIQNLNENTVNDFLRNRFLASAVATLGYKNDGFLLSQSTTQHVYLESPHNAHGWKMFRTGLDRMHGTI